MKLVFPNAVFAWKLDEQALEGNEERGGFFLEENGGCAGCLANEG